MICYSMNTLRFDELQKFCQTFESKASLIIPKMIKSSVCWVSMLLLQFSHPFALTSGRERETMQEKRHTMV